ncbi:Ig-like domain-containing protein [Undibacterium sp. Di24W]|uniref:Ig-like domain-containing protein n=1 Tax=Undibacterium sp. Di24W TaxID=3413033 RepID=UPI003BF29F93
MKLTESMLPMPTAIQHFLESGARSVQRLLFKFFLLTALIACSILSVPVQAQTILNSGATVNVTMTQGQTFSQNFEGTGTQDNVYTVVGTLPSGIGTTTIPKSPPATNGHELVMSGTPTTAGSYTFTVNVSATFFSVPVLYSTTINVTVLPPAPVAPTANGFSQSVTQNSTNNVLSPSTSGSVSSISVISTPLHGTATVSGLNIIYTPTSGYAGSDTFSYQATGPGGTSSAATVSITVAAAAFSVTPLNITILANTSANSIVPVITGSASSLIIVSGASHGSVSVNGLALRYTPAAGYVGSDSVVVIASNGSANSAPANISINVVEPSPILESSIVRVNTNSSANLINPSIQGNAASLSIIGMPTHGVVTLNGLDLRYTPEKGYAGIDQITLLALGTGGPSSTATITINVVNDLPVVNATTINVNANSSGNSIIPSTSGNVSSIAIRTPPGRGVAIISGLGVSYTPEPGFVGVDTLSVTATGIGGTSIPALITINVLAVAPVLTGSNVQVVANSVANSIIPKIAGLATTINIVSASSHGSVVLRGTELLYTPTTGYIGNDAVTITATGAGGVSNSVTITINVQAISASSNSVIVQANSTTNPLPVLSLAGAISLSVSAQPTRGVLAVNGMTLSYTPASNFVGTDSLTYAVLGSNGSFASATINISVVAAAPVAKNANLTVETGRSASIDLATLVSGPVFSGVTISLNTLPEHGVAGVSGTRVTYTPAPGYIGGDSINFTATAIGGVSNVAQLIITVVPRPDPSKDTGVLAMFTATTAAVRHFEQTQIEHFNGRMFELASQASTSKTDENKERKTECGPLAMWVSGLNSAGSYRSANGLKYTTMGFSAGGDRCFGGGKTHIGFGLGYARDHSEFERNPSFMTATANTAASYLTTQLFPAMRFSFMLGVNQIEDRFGRQDGKDLSMAFGQWKGTQMISSGSVSGDLSFSKIVLMPYVRLDMTKMKLDPFSETGAGSNLLHYHEQTMLSQRSTVGFNSEMKIVTSWGELIPRLKMEYQRDFARRDSLKINYIDLPDAIYLIPSNDVDRRMLLLSLGADMMWKNGIVTIFNYTHADANGGNKANRFNVRFSYQY